MSNAYKSKRRVKELDPVCLKGCFQTGSSGPGYFVLRAPLMNIS